MDPYFIAKWMHIISATVLFGTGIGTAFQMVLAMRTRRTETVADVATAVVLADWFFTIPAGVMQLATGLWLVHLQGHSLSQPWLQLAIVLYILAFSCWLPVAILQIRIRNMAAHAVREGTALPARVWRAYRIWFCLGWPAFGALLVVFWLMVSKPHLW
ncbi:DUF2269 domain-containing protein [Pseudohalocynthiibacter aestuariivivens]|uniref:DUF2269 domain-containing protein n=1 Tax=Roseovarius pelagicus TaxID=2980108 RepID=A0ABY6DCM8_9RHOB|nr:MULTISPECIES: DUF2269 domain-containing protein [Rhodobacterales]QIE45110.1 DUF2269 domain-containing protein [Pseudohalocynthiibacter aestuariivivens]UXX82953.1 DUF2269 domain-containing protein [Roseovarius pelagicus]